MDTLGWLPESYQEEIVKGEEPIEQGEAPPPCRFICKAPPHVVECEFFVVAHLDNPFWEADHKDAKDMEEEHKEEDGTRVKGEDEARMIGCTQQVDVLCRKKSKAGCNIGS